YANRSKTSIRSTGILGCYSGADITGSSSSWIDSYIEAVESFSIKAKVKIFNWYDCGGERYNMSDSADYNFSFYNAETVNFSNSRMTGNLGRKGRFFLSNVNSFSLNQCTFSESPEYLIVSDSLYPSSVLIANNTFNTTKDNDYTRKIAEKIGGIDRLIAYGNSWDPPVDSIPKEISFRGNFPQLDQYQSHLNQSLASGQTIIQDDIFFSNSKISGQRENLFTWSEALPAASNLGFTVSTDSYQAPNGTNTAEVLVINNSTNAPLQWFNKTLQIDSGEKYIISFWARDINNSGRLKLLISGIQDPTNQVRTTTINQENWFRYSIPFVANQNDIGLTFRVNSGFKPVGDSVAFWGVQVERYWKMRNYIPTMNSIVLDSISSIDVKSGLKISGDLTEIDTGKVNTLLDHYGNNGSAQAHSNGLVLKSDSLGRTEWQYDRGNQTVLTVLDTSVVLDSIQFAFTDKFFVSIGASSTAINDAGLELVDPNSFFLGKSINLNCSDQNASFDCTINIGSGNALLRTPLGTYVSSYTLNPNKSIIMWGSVDVLTNTHYWQIFESF
ncbi:MAG: hypothetical protein MRY83_06270, partial [Flavobacteriales bacterium]|nr:hypothetical protein [Flavobacteriales bacterium]